MEFDINRKRLFDLAAVAHDRYRPGYPETLVEDLISLSSLDVDSSILEVGSGTGKATVPLARRGFRIDGVEPGTNLAAIAAENCSQWSRVKIHVSGFETFRAVAGQYGLVRLV